MERHGTSRGTDSLAAATSSSTGWSPATPGAPIEGVPVQELRAEFQRRDFALEFVDRVGQVEEQTYRSDNFGGIADPTRRGPLEDPADDPENGVDDEQPDEQRISCPEAHILSNNRAICSRSGLRVGLPSVISIPPGRLRFRHGPPSRARFFYVAQRRHHAPRLAFRRPRSRRQAPVHPAATVARQHGVSGSPWPRLAAPAGARP